MAPLTGGDLVVIGEGRESILGACPTVMRLCHWPTAILVTNQHNTRHMRKRKKENMKLCNQLVMK